MARRFEPKDSLDDFPTPPWATRALLENVLRFKPGMRMSAWDPACGVGHMAKILHEYFGRTYASDVFNYGYGQVIDYEQITEIEEHINWIITNPPFRLAENFLTQSLKFAQTGVAMLTRTVFLESVGRYNEIFSVQPPTIVAQFSERVPMIKGRLDRTASTATGYCWLVWTKVPARTTQLIWIPPLRRAFERPNDYDIPSSQTSDRLNAFLGARLL